jgi:transposase
MPDLPTPPGPSEERVRERNHVIRLEQQAAIRQMAAEKMPISAIARELSVDRKTVRSLLRFGPPGERLPRAEVPSRLDPFKSYLQSRLAQYPLSSVRLLEEIRGQGFTGGYDLVKRFVRPLRKAREISAVVRFETAPGQQAQVDFGHFGCLEEDGVRRHLYGFSMILGYSRCRYLEFVTRITTPVLIQCHLNAFRYFGGYPDDVLYDNMTQVVFERALLTSEHKWNRQYGEFAAYYGFHPRLCWPYRPQTKGKIERTIRFARDNFFLGRTFTGVGDINRQAQRWCNTVNTERTHATTGRIPLDLLEEEPLHALDARPLFPVTLTETRKVSRECFVSFGSNRYSVPWRYAGREAQLRLRDRQLLVEVDNQEVCRHELRSGSGAVVRVKEHFAGLYSAVRQRNLSEYLRTHAAAPVPEVEERSLAVYDEFLTSGGRP